MSRDAVWVALMLIAIAMGIVMVITIRFPENFLGVVQIIMCSFSAGRKIQRMTRGKL